jgi:hypothetical protein
MSHFLPRRAGFIYTVIRVLSATNPCEIKDTSLHDQKVGVWCAISQIRIIGLTFFDDTVSVEHYCEVIFVKIMLP